MTKSEIVASGLSVRHVAARALVRRRSVHRQGQAVFNALANAFPEAVEPLRGGPLDPFHNDDLIEAFIAEVERRLSAPRPEGSET